MIRTPVGKMFTAIVRHHWRASQRDTDVTENFSDGMYRVLPVEKRDRLRRMALGVDSAEIRSWSTTGAGLNVANPSPPCKDTALWSRRRSHRAESSDRSPGPARRIRACQASQLPDPWNAPTSAVTRRSSVAAPEADRGRLRCLRCAQAGGRRRGRGRGRERTRTRMEDEDGRKEQRDRPCPAPPKRSILSATLRADPSPAFHIRHSTTSVRSTTTPQTTDAGAGAHADRRSRLHLLRPATRDPWRRTHPSVLRYFAHLHHQTSTARHLDPPRASLATPGPVDTLPLAAFPMVSPGSN